MQTKPSFECEVCEDSGYVGKSPCCECCPHDEHDHGICLDCGLDRTDHYVGDAEAYYEDD